VGVSIRRFAAGDTAAIDRLNARLAARGIVDRVYPESHTTLAEARGDSMSQEMYVAVDENGEARGGVWLHEHEFVHCQSAFRAGWLKYPVSESLIDREYSGVPGALILTLMRRQPEIMALGMGHRSTPFAQLLASIGWTIIDVPFHVAAVRPSRVVQHLPQIRRSRMLKRWATVVAYSGLPALATAPLNALRYARSRPLLGDLETEPVTEFGQWTDAVWKSSLGKYGFVARRDAAMLNQFYPKNFPRLTRLRVKRRGTDIGWVCTTLAEPTSQGAFREFGELRVGLLADAFGDPTDAPALIATAMHSLMEQGADLIVTNQMHRAWRAPLRTLGFLQRPTNFLFGVSKKMTQKLAPQIAAGDIFLNRGDCDGPPRWF
jgi:hypothetical protein